MSEENGHFWKYLLAGGVGVGAWELYKRYQANTPDGLQSDALKFLQQDFNPFSSDDINQQLRAIAKLEEARFRREHQGMEKRGLPIDKGMEEDVLELSRLNQTGGYGQGGTEQYMGALGRLFQQAKLTAADLGHQDFPSRSNCPTCSDQGWQICSACHGIGTNREVPYPSLTGNQVVDALIMQRYQVDSLCPVCRGAGKVICGVCSRGF